MQSKNESASFEKWLTYMHIHDGVANKVIYVGYAFVRFKIKEDGAKAIPSSHKKLSSCNVLGLRWPTFRKTLPKLKFDLLILRFTMLEIDSQSGDGFRNETTMMTFDISFVIEQ